MSDDRNTTAKFLRGLTIGALLGALVVGSGFLSRWFDRLGRRPD